MTISNYSELKSEVAGWLHRDNLTARIPTFIKLAEERIKKHLRVFEMLSQEPISVSGGNPSASLPTGFIKMRSLRIDNSSNGKVLTYRPLAAIRDSQPSAGNPKYYSYEDGQLFLSPTPSGDMTLIAECLVMPSALSDQNPTNALLTAYPSMYLQGALTEGYTYLRNRERLADAKGLFEQSIAEANKASRELMKSGVSAPAFTFKRSIP